MPSFKAIDNISEINLSDNWINSTKFYSKGRIVGKNGKPVSSKYKGHQYRLVSKKERTFSRFERGGRGFLGTLAVVFSLGIALLFKPVRNLFTKEKEKIRFGILVPPSSNTQNTTPVVGSTNSSADEHSISEQELQNGISISENTMSKIQTCMENILQLKEEGGVKLYNSQRGHRVFSLDVAPEYIFKMNASKNVLTDGSMKARYQSMINAQTICRTHQLGLLVIPNVKLFTIEVEGEEYEIIAEKKLDINPSESVQEQHFEEYAPSLNETIRQLAVFICKTGYSDVKWSNNPVLNNSLDEFGLRKIALIDIEEVDSETIGLMDRKEFGLFGGVLKRRGLVECVNEEQGKVVKKVAKENGVSTSLFAEAYACRKEELQKGRELKEYYVTKKIITGYEPLQVDVNSLGLDLTEEAVVEEIVRKNGRAVKKDGDHVYQERVITLEEVTKNVITEINKSIQEGPDDATIKAKRYIHLSTKRDPIKTYKYIPIPESQTSTSKEEEKMIWLRRIIDSLIEKGHIFNLDVINALGYSIQA